MSKIAEGAKGLGQFLRECRLEFDKIVWPKRKELIESTWVVGAVILLLSLFVFVCDQLLTLFLKLLVGLSA
ncbi:MAG: preprotein translocase subunit SecE [Kiritimatiellia bacterium]|jgi:preprotein translocase subunit SecE